MLRASVQLDILTRLNNGQIIGYENPDARVWADGNSITGEIRVNRATYFGSAFSQGDDFAFTLAHEWGHIVQWGGLPAEAKIRLLVQYNRNQAWADVWEANANQHACWALSPAAKAGLQRHSCD